MDTKSQINFNNILKNEQDISPWQYKTYDIKPVTFMPIESDIRMYWDKRTISRKGYKVDNDKKELYVPNFFIKINGKHKNNKEYINFVKYLIEAKNTLTVNDKLAKNIPNYYLNTKKEDPTNIEEYIKSRDFINNDSDIVEQFVEYYFNKESKLEHKLSNIVYDKQLQIKKIIIKTIKAHLKNWTTTDLEEYLGICFNIPQEIAILLNNFDYNYDVPKIVCINIAFTRQEAILMKLLNELAFDIIILDTRGFVTIEKYIEIISLSLGYFDKNFKTYEKCIPFNKKILSCIKDINPTTWGGFINISTMIISVILIILGLFFFNGWVNTLIEILSIVIVVAVGKLLCHACLLYNEEAHGNAVIFYVVAVCALLFIRFIGFGINSSMQPESTMTYTGTLNIADSTLDTKNDFIIHSKKDSAIIYGTNDLNLYIENNEINERDIYIKIFYNDQLYYYSTPISPYEYINHVDLEYNISGHSETEKLTIKYFLYNEGYTGELLGSEEIILHIVQDEEELKEFFK